MKTPTTALLTLIFTALSAFGAPEPGVYTGVVTVNRALFSEGLSARQTLKAQANVKADGSLTILTTVPEAPAAATLDSATTRAVPVPPPDEVPIGTPENPPPATQPFPGNYLVDGKFPANVFVQGRSFILIYQNPQPAPNPSTIVTFTDAISFEFSFRKSR